MCFPEARLNYSWLLMNSRNYTILYLKSQRFNEVFLRHNFTGIYYCDKPTVNKDHSVIGG